MTTEGARRIVAKLEDERAPLRKAAERLGLDRMEETTSSGWTVKEMLAHVAFWEETPIGFVTTAMRGQPLSEEPDAAWRFGSGYVPDEASGWPPDYVHNAREAEWARSQTPALVIARWDRAHENLVEFLGTVTDEEAEKHAAYFLHEIPVHFGNHLPELQALLDQGPRSE